MQKKVGEKVKRIAYKKRKYFEKRTEYEFSYEETQIQKIAGQIIHAYQKCTSIAGLKIIHSIIFNIATFNPIINKSLKQPVAITSENLLEMIFILDEQVGNEHILFLGDSENINFLKLELSVSIDDIKELRDRNIYYLGDFHCELIKSSAKELDGVIAGNVQIVGEIITKMIKPGIGEFFLTILPPDIKEIMQKSIKGKEDEYYHDPLVFIENRIEQEKTTKALLKDRIYIAIRNKPECCNRFIHDLKKILNSHFGCIRDVLAENNIAGNDPFGFVHELFDNEADYEGEEYGDINIALRFKNRIEHALHLISTQIYLKTWNFECFNFDKSNGCFIKMYPEIRIRTMHPIEVIEARFCLYLEKRGVIPVRFSGQGNNKEEQLKKELAFKKKKGFVKSLGKEETSALNEWLRELLLEFRIYIMKKGLMNRETDIILEQVENVFATVKYSIIKRGYGNFVSYRDKNNYEYFYREGTTVYLTKSFYYIICTRTKKVETEKKARALLFVYIIEKTVTIEIKKKNEILSYLNKKGRIGVFARKKL